MKRTIEVTDFSLKGLEMIAANIASEFRSSDRAKFAPAFSDDVRQALVDSAVMRWLMRQHDANCYTAATVQDLCIRVRELLAE